MDKEEGLEYLSLSDSAWYDVDVATSRVVRAQTEEKGPVYALKLAWKGDDDQQSGCRYLDSPKDLCRLEDLDLRLRRQSQPVQDEQCRSVRPGMQVVALCKHANGQRKYYTATIKAARHRDHPPAEDCCICSFDVVYQPDRSANGGQVAMPPHEASLGLEDLCFPGGPAKGHPAVEGWRSQLAQLAKGGGNQQAAKQQQQQQEAKPAHFPLAPRRVAPVSSGSPKQAARGGTRTPPRSARLGARENGDAASAGAAAAEADTVAGGGEAACQQEPPAAPCPRKAPLKVRLPRAPNGTAAAAAGAACSDGGGAAAAAGSGSTGQPAAAAAPAPTGVREEVAGAAAAAGSSDEDAEGAAPQAAPHAPRALPAGLSVTGGLLKGPAPELNTALQAALDGVRGSAEVVSEAPGGQASEAAAGHEPAGSAGPGPEQDPSPRVKREREEDEQQQDQAERPRPAVKHEPHWEQAQRRSEERLWDEAARGGGREVGGPGMGATLTSPFLLHQNGAAAGASDGAGHHAHAEAAARPPVAAAGASFSAPSASRSLSQQQQQPLPSQLVDLVAGPDGLPDLLTAPQRASVARMACAPVRWLDAGPFGLPDRWVCYEKQRTSGATGRLGHKDRYFLSPEGKVCRSHTQALAHLAALAPGARPAPPPRPAAFAAAHEAAGGGGGEGRPVRKRARREPSAWLLDSDDSNATQEPEPEPRDEDEGDDWVPSGDDDGNESDEMGRAPPSLLARRTAAAAAGAGAAGAGGMQAAVAAAAAARPAGRIKLKARQPLGGLGFGGPLAASGNSAHLGTGHFALPQQLQQQQQQPPQLHTQHEALPQQQQRQSHQQPQQQGQQAAPAAAAAAAAVAERSRADSEAEAAFSDAEDLSMQFSLPLTLRDVLRLAHLYSDGAVDLGAGARRALVDGVAEAMPELQVRLGEARADAALATSAVLLEAPHLMHWGRRVLTDAGRASLLARADGAARARHQQQQQQQQRRPAHSARQAASGAATDGLTEGQQQGSAPACDQQQQERFAAAPEQAREQQQERQQQEVQQQQERQQEQQQQEQQERHGLKEQLHRDHVAANKHESPAPTQCLREPAQQEQEQRRQEQQQRQGPQQQQQHQQVVHMQVPPAALPSSGPLPPVAPVH